MADIFAKIGDIKGESRDAKHKDEIEVLSISWGVTNSGTVGGGGAGKPTFPDLSIIHRVDKATPKLLETCATGKRLPDAIVTQRKPGGGQQEYLIIKMSDVTVTGVGFDDPNPDAAVETVKLAFSKVHLEYRPIKADGSLDAPVQFKFDLKLNKPG